MITAEERAKWRSEHAGCVRSGLTCFVVRLLDELETAERELALARAVVEALRTSCEPWGDAVLDAMAAYDAREVTP
jgi:hypothetical protein